MISLYQTTDKRRVETLVNKATAVGGVGLVYQDNQTYHILGACYLLKDEAVAVKEKNKKIVSSIEIVEVSAPQVLKKIKNQISTNVFYKQLFENLIETTFIVDELSSKYHNGRDIFVVYKDLVKQKLKLQANLESVDKTNKCGQVLIEHLNVFLLSITNCLDQIYKNEGIEKNLRKLLMECCFEEVLLRKSLNGL